jgi:hypothetical protein
MRTSASLARTNLLQLQNSLQAHLRVQLDAKPSAILVDRAVVPQEFDRVYALRLCCNFAESKVGPLVLSSAHPIENLDE